MEKDMNGDTYFGQARHDYMTTRGAAFARLVVDRVATPGLAGLTHAIELGAGAGRFTRPLAERFDKLTLVEPVTAYADTLEQTFGPGGARVVRQPAESWLPAQPTDQAVAVFAFHVLHHLNPAQQTAVFDWIRLSRSTGVFVEPNPWNPLILAQIIATPAMRLSEERRYLRQTRSRMEAIFQAHGLDVVQYQRFLVAPPFLADRLLRMGLGSLVKGLEILRFLPFMASYQSFVVSRV